MQEKILKISELNKIISDQLNQLEEFEVEGEISEWKMYHEKIVYFTFKDEKAAVQAMTNIFELKNWEDFEEGMLVRAHVEIKFNQTKGSLYAWAKEMVPHGEGALKIAFEKLKKKLEVEGLFSVERKRQIVKFPQRIGLITSDDGAAVKDFKKILNSRLGGLKIYFYPVRVEGRSAIPDILKAFEYFNNFKELLDGIVLIRGGGGLESLQAFNDEKIVRCVAASRFPVITGVGHENDFTLCDFCADIRASTPSNAAELLVEHRIHLLEAVDNSLISISKNIKYEISQNNHQLDNMLMIIKHSVRSRIEGIKSLISAAYSALTLPKIKIGNLDQHLDDDLDTIERIIRHKLDLTKQLVKSSALLLNTLNPKNVLKMGYSVVRGDDKKIIKSAGELEISNNINAFFYEGSIRAKVIERKV